VRSPQSLWLRAAVFQIHLWTGIATGLYILVICVSGSILVYRNELFRLFSSPPVIVPVSGTRLTVEQLEDAARRAYPHHEVAQVWAPMASNQAVEIQLQQSGKKRQRLFDPYTGKDLGNPLRAGFRVTAWLRDLHDNLLAGPTGRRINGVGATFVILLCVSGLVVWWPGISKWRRSLTIDLSANWTRFMWSTHSALGIWFVLFTLMWGISGIYFSFPKPFDAVSHFLDPPDASTGANRLGDTVLYGLAYAHFGRFAGWPGQLLWALVGLVPPALFLTGVVMWVNRVVRRKRMA
jgi:uncharacterized iron-regulated membrane protein